MGFTKKQRREQHKRHYDRKYPIKHAPKRDTSPIEKQPTKAEQMPTGVEQMSEEGESGGKAPPLHGGTIEATLNDSPSQPDYAG